MGFLEKLIDAGLVGQLVKLSYRDKTGEVQHKFGRVLPNIFQKMYKGERIFQFQTQRIEAPVDIKDEEVLSVAVVDLDAVAQLLNELSYNPQGLIVPGSRMLYDVRT